MFHRTSAAAILFALLGVGGTMYLHCQQSTIPPSAIQSVGGPSLPGPHNIYSETADAKKDIVGALALARKKHHRVLLDFGANWCPDCRALDFYFHQPPNSTLLEQNYVLVHVDVGRMDKNLDVAHSYSVLTKKGIPALVVVEPSGRVVYSQSSGEFNTMRTMQSASVTEFLTKWKPSDR